MNNADICTKESDLKICFGDLYLPDEGTGTEPRESAYSSVKYLYSDLTDIRKYYIRLGFHLEEFSRCGYFRDFGFASLYAFCEANLGLDKGSVSRCISVYRAFNASGSSFRNGVETRGCAMEIADKWKDYSYTQLCEMLPLTEEQRSSITPDMSVSRIREYKKNLKQGKPVASTQPEPLDLKKYDNSTGTVRQDIIKNCTPVKDNVSLTVFDKNGKLCGSIVCDMVCAQNGRYYFRLWQSDDSEENNKE